MQNMPHPQRQHVSVLPEHKLAWIFQPTKGRKRNGKDVMADVKPRHCNGLRSLTMMSVTRSKPAWPAAQMTRPMENWIASGAVATRIYPRT